MQLVYLAMGVVIAGFLLLALTSANAELHNNDVLRLAALGVWILIVTVGWLVIARLAFVSPGGLDGAWHWTLQQPLPQRIAMWVFLLPYMGALGIWQLGWAAWQRTTAIVILALATYLLSLRRR